MVLFHCNVFAIPSYVILNNQDHFGKSTYFRFHCELTYVLYCNINNKELSGQHNTTTVALVAEVTGLQRSSLNCGGGLYTDHCVGARVHVWSDYRIKRSGWVNIKFWEDCEVSTSV